MEIPLPLEMRKFDLVIFNKSIKIHRILKIVGMKKPGAGINAHKKSTNLMGMSQKINQE